MVANNRQGRRQKFTIEEHKARGTYRADRMGGRDEQDALASVPLYTKPKPARKKKPARKWIKGPADLAAIDAGYWFDYGWAKYACTWIETRLQLVEGVWSGQPFKLMPWQKDIVQQLFGWVCYDKEWKMVTRRYKRALVMVPKKSGKSPFAAALSLMLGYGDTDQMGADIAIIATDKIQASNVGKHAARMVRGNPHLEARSQINEREGRIVNTKTESLVRTMAHNPNQLEGLNLNGCICDELHVWRDARVLDALHFAGISRPDFLQLMITTAGDDVQSICHQMYEYGKGINDGTISDHQFYCRIFEADPEDDWTKVATWKKANPSYGHTIKGSELRRSCNEAKQNTRLQNAFKRYRLNIWTQPEQAWLDYESWKQCGTDIPIEHFEGVRCHAGLDLSKTRDLTALVLMFFDPDADTYFQYPFFWMPEEMAKRRNKFQPYMSWADLDHLTLTPGDVVDYPLVREGVQKLNERFTIQSIVFDPWNAEECTQKIEDDIGIERVEFQQTMRHFNGPCQEYERRVLNNTIKHPQNPILDWQASHVLIKEDENKNIRPVKRAGGDIRTIDGIVAGIMALAQCLERPAPLPNYYDSNPLEAI